jgi:hypothetical protein
MVFVLVTAGWNKLIATVLASELSGTSGVNLFQYSVS